MSGRVDDDDRDAELAQPGDRVGRVEAVAAGDDEVGLEADDLLDVDRVELRDVRDGGRLGRIDDEVLALADDPSPTPRANRISVAAGVSETIFVGSAAMLDGVPSSSVR